MMLSQRPRFAWIAVVCATLFVLAPASAFALEVMCWNTLNYPGSTAASRNPNFQAVIAAVSPDILVCQEIRELAGAQAFKTGVLDVIHPGQWTLAVFTDGPDSDNALYVRTSAGMTVASYGWLNTSPRHVDWWQLRPSGNLSPEGDLILYSAHLKAGTTSTDQEDRRVAARAIRDHLIATWTPEQHTMVMGDFNLYTSTESAYGALTGNPIEPAQMFDPIATPGSWNNNAAYAAVHTQSTRTTQLSDGGSTGGMDDRFDFILIDAELSDTESWDYLTGTYEAFGQDGLRFNNAVNALPVNAAVGQTLADALYNSSDHLPIVLELQTPARAQVLPASIAFGSVLQGTPAASALQLRNATLAGADELDYTFLASPPLGIGGTSSGEINPGQVAAVQVIVDTNIVGEITPNVGIQTDDPVNSLIEVPVTGRVVRASRPSWDGATDVVSTATSVTIPADAAGELTLDVHNVGYDVDQARLYVTGAGFSGPDAARFSLLDPAAFFVSGAAVQRRVAIDGVGLPGGTVLEATLTLTAQDDFLVTGAQTRGPLVIAISAEVDAGVTAAPPVITRSTLYAPVPTPFNPRTTLSFDVARAGHARLEVFDVRGRRVDVLVDETLPAGRYTRVWEAEDAAGAQLASGVYLIRFSTGDFVQVRRAVLVR